MILYNFGQQMTVSRVLNHWDSRPDLVLAFSVLDETSFAFFSSVICLKNSHHLPDQLNKTIRDLIPRVTFFYSLAPKI